VTPKTPLRLAHEGLSLCPTEPTWLRRPSSARIPSMPRPRNQIEMQFGVSIAQTFSLKCIGTTLSVSSMFALRGFVICCCHSIEPHSTQSTPCCSRHCILPRRCPRMYYRTSTSPGRPLVSSISSPFVDRNSYCRAVQWYPLAAIGCPMPTFA
jgi:hypothetical protein